MSGKDLSAFSLWELYRAEVETHAATLSDGLLALEQQPGDVDRIKALMRAAHSIKGAARVVQHPLAVDVAHAMEDRLVAAQSGRAALGPTDIQHLLDGVDLLVRLSPAAEGTRDGIVESARADAAKLIADLSIDSPSTAAPTAPPAAPAPPPAPATLTPAKPAPERAKAEPAPSVAEEVADRTIRLTAQGVERLLGLTGEATVAMQWLPPFSERLLRLKRDLSEVSGRIERLENLLFGLDVGDELSLLVNDIQSRLEAARAELVEQYAALESFALRQDTITSRLHGEVVSARMRPFGDIAEGFPRLVRDLAKQLNKSVVLRIDGKSTQVDRDVATLLESPLIHLLRNAVDHGLETSEARLAAGKPETGTVVLSAFHRAGMLRVSISDDGRGVDLATLRGTAVARGLTDESTAQRLSDDELLAFLFLPGFSTAKRVSDVSGRGVGLDVVQEAMKTVGGRVQVTNSPGAGLRFTFDLPLTLSTLQAIIVEIAGEPYAFPLTRVERAVIVPRETVKKVEGREYFTMAALGAAGNGGADDEAADERHVGLVSARQVLGIGGARTAADSVSVIVIRDGHRLYGLAVDRVTGEQAVIVRPLDQRLGKVKDIGAAALMADGTPLLLFDTDDVARSVEQILTTERLAALTTGTTVPPLARKRVLVVDDSITVREIERQLLEAHGYDVDVAVDGVDGWNALRTGRYELVVTDVDMPRLDGIELVRRIRGDRRYSALPVMIVSYKDRDEDRLRGLDAGASYYLPKSSFQDERFLKAVDELIGEESAPGEARTL
jgi:two-component system sensor histidine kinase and response regulator WspE